MKSIFSPDTKFGRLFYTVGQMIILSVVWLILCIPVVTAGAASSALYYTCRKLLQEEEGKVMKTYFSSFKSNFKQSVFVGIISFLVCGLLIYNAGIYYYIEKTGFLSVLILIFFWLIALFAVVWCHVVTAYLARFEDTTKTILKNAFLMCLMNPKLVLRVGAQFALFVAAALFLNLIPYLPTVICLVPSGYCMMLIDPMEKMFQKYIPAETKEEVPAIEETAL